MRYTVSWYDDRYVLFRVSFSSKYEAQSYFNETIDIVDRGKCSEYF